LAPRRTTRTMMAAARWSMAIFRIDNLCCFAKDGTMLVAVLAIGGTVDRWVTPLAIWPPVINAMAHAGRGGWAGALAGCRPCRLGSRHSDADFIADPIGKRRGWGRDRWVSAFTSRFAFFRMGAILQGVRKKKAGDGGNASNPEKGCEARGLCAALRAAGS